MACGAATTTFSIAEPFQEAVRSVREVLAAANLSITGELDLSSRIRRRLLIRTKPCLILFVSPSGPALQALSGDPHAAVQIPVHIVVSACGSGTEIHVLRVLPREGDPGDRLSALREVLAEISRAMEKIAMRATLAP